MKILTVIKKLMISLFVVGAVVGVVGTGTGTFATFTAQTAVAGNTFATGTVDISANPAQTLIGFGNMAPGDVITPKDGLEIKNEGSLDLRYGMSTTATNDDGKGLAAQLQLAVTNYPPTGNCGSVNYDTNLLYSGPLANGSFNKVQVLAAGITHALCFRVSLPIDTENQFQGASTTATFTFDAEQTVNNP